MEAHLAAPPRRIPKFVYIGFSGFSTFINNNDRHVNLGHKPLENGIIVKGNDKLWSDHERADLIEIALEIDMSKRCSTTMDGWKRLHDENNDEDSSTDNDDSDRK